MPEASLSTPFARPWAGRLEELSGIMRADDLAAVPLRALVERNPDIAFGETNDVMMGCGFPDHEQGLQRRPQRGAAVGARPPAF